MLKPCQITLDGLVYALKAVALRESFERAWIVWDFYVHYETEALVRGGEESKARAAVQRQGERLGSNRRSRIAYLRSLAVLAAWEGHSEDLFARKRQSRSSLEGTGLLTLALTAAEKDLLTWLAHHPLLDLPTLQAVLRPLADPNARLCLNIHIVN